MTSELRGTGTEYWKLQEGRIAGLQEGKGQGYPELALVRFFEHHAQSSSEFGVRATAAGATIIAGDT
jgi:hypothetical protein